jgi:hypothetical protein
MKQTNNGSSGANGAHGICNEIISRNKSREEKHAIDTYVGDNKRYYSQ